MKKLFALGFAAMMMLTLTLTSCNKYEDGPGFSLRSAKARISRTWKPVEYVSSNGTTVAASSSDGTYTFDKDGTFSYTSGNLSASGTWEFNGDKTTITTTISGISNTETITRLSTKELWTKDSNGTVTKSEAQ